MGEISPFEPTVLGAMWRFRWLVLLILVGMTGLSAFYGISRPVQYQASALLVVEDPRVSSLFDTGNVSRPERYVANQAAILQSTTVAERAALIGAPDAAALADPGVILAGLGVFSSNADDNISLQFTAGDPEAAVVAVNAVVGAYRELRQESTAAVFSAGLAQLDDSIGEVDAQLGELQAHIRNKLLANSAREELDKQFEAAIVAIVDVQAALARASVPDRPVLRAELDDLFRQLQVLQLVISLDTQKPEFSALLQEQERTVARKAGLVERRDGLVVESRLESTGIVLESPALGAVSIGTDLFRTIAVGVVLGTLLAAGAAYLLALRRRTFTDRSQPELVLNAPLIAEVPDFSDESLKGELPVYAHPASVSAEAFRFVASAIDLAAGMALRGSGAPGPGELGRRATRKVLAVVSSSQGDGKTVVVANTALAAARLGERVLVIDADFGDQRLTDVIVGASASVMGITEVVERGITLARAVQQVDLPGGAAIDLLSRGQVPVMAPDFFRSKGVEDLFDAVGEAYDLVLVDMPPLLLVAYASTILRYCDRPVVVVPHGGAVSTLEELSDRLVFLGADPIGYVYNRAPLREGRTHGQGSMKDTLGRPDTER